MSRKICIANWKMNPASSKEAEILFKNTAKAASGLKKTEIVICPPVLYLEKIKKLSGRSAKKIYIGAQDAFWKEEGAFTGQVSALQLREAGAKYVILGHSERRDHSSGGGDTNETVNKKLKASLAIGFSPVLCFGEPSRDEEHQYLNFIRKEIEECLSGIPKEALSKIIVAYEPIWAIGKGATAATAEECREMVIFARKVLSDKFGLSSAERVKIIYGGSVDERNVAEFLNNGEVDGFLVGRASLDAGKFSNIVNACEASEN